MQERELEEHLRKWLAAKGYQLQDGPQPIDLLAINRDRSLWIECKGDQKNVNAVRNAYYMGLGQLVSRYRDPDASNAQFVLAVSGQYLKNIVKSFTTLPENFSLWLVRRLDELPTEVSPGTFEIINGLNVLPIVGSAI